MSNSEFRAQIAVNCRLERIEAIVEAPLSYPCRAPWSRMATDIALEVLKTGEGLPYVGPLCTAIQQIIDIINVSKNVRQVYMEEFPTELRMMQVISAS